MLIQGVLVTKKDNHIFKAFTYSGIFGYIARYMESKDIATEDVQVIVAYPVKSSSNKS